jgi:hypothetical protein
MLSFFRKTTTHTNFITFKYWFKSVCKSYMKRVSYEEINQEKLFWVFGMSETKV